MSLLADLFSKLKDESAKSRIPPTLERVVLRSREQRRARKKVVVAGSVAAFIIVGGVISTYYLYRTSNSSQSPSIAASSIVRQPQPNANSSQPVTSQQETKSPAAPAPLRTPAAAASRGSAPDLIRVRSVGHNEGHDGAAKDRTHEAGGGELSESRPGEDKAQKEESAGQKAKEDEYLYAARNYEASRDYDQALSYYKKVLESDRQNYVVMSNIASILILKGAFNNASDYARSALDINKDHVPSLVNLGIACIQLGNMNEGSAALLKALSLQPTNKYALLNLGVLYEKQNNYEEARGAYARLSSLGDVQGYLGAARVAETTGKLDDARRAYRAVVVLDGADSAARKFANERLMALEHR